MLGLLNVIAACPRASRVSGFGAVELGSSRAAAAAHTHGSSHPDRYQPCQHRACVCRVSLESAYLCHDERTVNMNRGKYRMFRVYILTCFLV